MKLWFATALVGMLAIAGCGGSPSDSSATPSGTSVTVTATATPRATPEVSCGEKTCVPVAPTPTAPLSCSFGSGIWEQCEKQAQSAAFADLFDRYHYPANSGAVVSSEYVEWPDSCLGVQTPGVMCLQVITPGYRMILRGADTPFIEYHTDLNGHAVFVAEYATYQDVLPTYTDVLPTYTPR